MFIKARSITASQTGRIYDSNLLLHQNQCLANGEETIYGLGVSLSEYRNPTIIFSRNLFCKSPGVGLRRSQNSRLIRSTQEIVRKWISASTTSGELLRSIRTE